MSEEACPFCGSGIKPSPGLHATYQHAENVQTCIIGDLAIKNIAAWNLRAASTGDERREAIEECAKVAEEVELRGTGYSATDAARVIRSLLHADGGEKPCEHEWSEWENVLGGRGYHVERKCSKCGKEQYDD